MKSPNLKDYMALKNQEKLPRKRKKMILGKRLTGRKLKALLDSVIITYNKSPESSSIHPFTFCPKCGCQLERSTGNKVAYPEIWEDLFCCRCGAWVGGADNSPFHHILEEIHHNKNF